MTDIFDRSRGGGLEGLIAETLAAAAHKVETRVDFEAFVSYQQTSMAGDLIDQLGPLDSATEPTDSTSNVSSGRAGPTPKRGHCGEPVREQPRDLTIDEPEPFDLDPADVRATRRVSHGRRDRRRWLAVAAIAAVIAAIAAASIWVGRDHRGRPVSVPVGAAQLGGQPTWLPDGYQLIDAHSGPVSAATGERMAVQAYGAKDRPAVLIEVGKTQGVLGTYDPDLAGANGQVRGTSAITWGRGEGEPPPTGNEDTLYRWASTQVLWIDHGDYLRASFADTSLEDTVAQLDAATFNDPANPYSGFTADSFSGHKLLDEYLDYQDGPATSTTLTYSADLATTRSQPDLQVTASVGPSTIAPYYQAWAAAGRDGDGVLISANSPESTASTDGVNPLYSEGSLLGPDGTTASAISTVLDADQLKRVLRSVVGLGRHEFDVLRSEVSAKLYAQPMVATATIAGATLTTHQVGRQIAVCYQVPASDPACTAGLEDALKSSAAWGTIAEGSRWLIYAAAPTPPLFGPLNDADFAAGVAGVPGPWSPDTQRYMTELAPATAASNGTYFAVATFDATTHQVVIGIDDGKSLMASGRVQAP